MTRRFLTLPFMLVAALATISPSLPRDGYTTSAAQVSNSTPTVDQIIDAYVQAIGGKKAFDNLTTRLIKGKWENSRNGLKASFVIYAKAPNRYAFVLENPRYQGVAARAFDGETGWSANLMETGLRQLSGRELADLQRVADFKREIKLRENYPNLAFKGMEKVEGQDAYVLEATPEGGLPERFYFNSRSGLLVRHDQEYENSRGRIQVQHYLSDYREVDGIKLPFSSRTVSQAFETTLRVEEVKHNVPIDDQKFKKPSP